MTDEDFPSAEAMLAGLDAWATNLKDDFVWKPVREDKGFAHEKIPAVRSLVTPPMATPEIYRCCTQSILKAAENLARVKPQNLGRVRTTAVIGYPDMFQSEVCVFFDPHYWHGFTHRTEAHDCWTPLQGRSLAKEFGLKIPDHFIERGWHNYWRDDSFDPPYEEDGETWIYHERLAGE